MTITFNQLAGLVLGVFFTGWAFVRRNHRLRLLQNGVVANGKVIRIEEIPSDDGFTYKPVIEFHTSAKETVTKMSQLSTNPCPYKVGDAIKVIYDPQNIDDFTLNDGPALSVEIVFFAIGITALVYAAIVFYLAI
jgi:hypothetical protein